MSATRFDIADLIEEREALLARIAALESTASSSGEGPKSPTAHEAIESARRELHHLNFQIARIRTRCDED